MSHRPGFVRADTDYDHGAVELNDLDKSGQGSSRQKTWHEEDGTEKGASTGVAALGQGENTGIYNVEAEGHYGTAEVVRDAKDVVTRRIACFLTDCKPVLTMYQTSSTLRMTQVSARGLFEHF